MRDFCMRSTMVERVQLMTQLMPGTLEASQKGEMRAGRGCSARPHGVRRVFCRLSFGEADEDVDYAKLRDKGGVLHGARAVDDAKKIHASGTLEKYPLGHLFPPSIYQMRCSSYFPSPRLQLPAPLPFRI